MDKINSFNWCYFKIQGEAVERGKKHLQMPPVMKCREDVEHILSDNPEIEGFDQHPYVFTDISYNLPDRVSVQLTRQGKCTTYQTG